MVDTTQEFNWESAAEHHSVHRVAFYRENFNKPLTEGQFVDGMQRIKKFSASKHGIGRANENYRPSKLKKLYQNLKTRFGFFN